MTPRDYWIGWGLAFAMFGGLGSVAIWLLYQLLLVVREIAQAVR